MEKTKKQWGKSIMTYCSETSHHPLSC